MTIGPDGATDGAGLDGGGTRAARLELVAQAAKQLRLAETKALTQLQGLGEVVGDPDGAVTARILAPVTAARQALDRALEDLTVTRRAR